MMDGTRVAAGGNGSPAASAAMNKHVMSNR